ncbi:hypothetical protein Acor_51770 [Acrocarpospora corrugata]|uniref:Death-on-curing protein n=1 Tax=Acrocarpospora corrugata TaxID=35763 RepID=A0A5M3W7H5_9ACTN|nr:hypothetical protein Acor_51770 [Acrocarpospora corrugata]
MRGQDGELILYRTEDGRSQIQLRAAGGTVWLTQAQMAELFDTSVPNINQRITAILEDGELTEATINSELIVRQEGSRQVRREVLVYNLDMVLAVGYRVRSLRGIQFRQWASMTLREYLIKGFVLDDERLKEPGGFDYFDELRSGSGRSAPRRSGSIRRFVICLPRPARITTNRLTWLGRSSPRSRTSWSTPSPAGPPPS